VEFVLKKHCPRFSRLMGCFAMVAIVVVVVMMLMMATTTTAAWVMTAVAAASAAAVTQAPTEAKALMVVMAVKLWSILTINMILEA
jgi:hypothetical protein